MRWSGWLAGLLMASAALASSHREAPLIARDPLADTTDLYAFVSPERSDRVVVIANWIPLEKRESGPNFWGFDDEALYQIHVDSDGDASEDVIYQFRFTTTRRSGDTFLYNTGPVAIPTDEKLNVRQSYEIVRIRAGVREVLGRDLPVAPPHIGSTSIADYASLRTASVVALPDTSRVFVGQRAETFFVDLGAVFDLLQISTVNPRPAVNATRESNVHSIALEIPKTLLTKSGTLPPSAADAGAVLGFWATTSRRQITLRRPQGRELSRGGFVQVSRLGMPLVNEVLIPLGSKDRFNASHPRDDAQFERFFTDPELPRLLTGLFGVNCPAAPRNDLAAVFLTGIAGLTQIPGGRSAEMLRLNIGIAPSTNPDRLGQLAGDAAGFPNGRRPGDDVVDITLRAAAGTLASGFDIEPNRSLSDGVDSPEVAVMTTFPFLPDPHPAR